MDTLYKAQGYIIMPEGGSGLICLSVKCSKKIGQWTQMNFINISLMLLHHTHNTHKSVVWLYYSVRKTNGSYINCRDMRWCHWSFSLQELTEHVRCFTFVPTWSRNVDSSPTNHIKSEAFRAGCPILHWSVIMHTSAKIFPVVLRKCEDGCKCQLHTIRNHNHFTITTFVMRTDFFTTLLAMINDQNIRKVERQWIKNTYVPKLQNVIYYSFRLAFM